MKLQPSSKARRCGARFEPLARSTPEASKRPRWTAPSPARAANRDRPGRAPPVARRRVPAELGRSRRRCHWGTVTPTIDPTIPWNSVRVCRGHGLEMRSARPAPRRRRWNPCVASASLVFGHLGPLRNGGRLHLDVELHAPRPVPDAQRLDGAVIVAGQDGRAWRRLFHRGPVPLQAPQDLGEVAEDRVVQALWGQADLHDADLGFFHRPDSPAEGVGQQLVTQADPEVGPVKFGDPVPDGGLLRHQPWMFVLLPHIHRTAHGDEHVEAIQRRDLFALIELDAGDGQARRRSSIGPSAPGSSSGWCCRTRTCPAEGSGGGVTGGCRGIP